MEKPKKVIVEITAQEYSLKVFDADGNVLYEQLNTMESRSRSVGQSGHDYFGLPIGIEYGSLGDAIDDMNFGPFGVACALHDIESGYTTDCDDF